MAKMRQMDVKEQAKVQVIQALQDGKFFEKAEQVGNFSYAYPTEFDIEGDGNVTEVWVQIDLTAKNWFDTSKTKAFDVFQVQADYQADLELKAKAKAEKEKAKAEKLAKKNAKANA